MPVGSWFCRITGLIFGGDTEQKRHQIRLDQQHAPPAEWLKDVSSSIPPDPPSQKQSGHNQGLKIPGSQHDPPSTSPVEIFPGSRSPSEDFLKQAYQAEDRNETAGRDRYFDSNGMPYLPKLKGIGRYRMAVDADEEHQLGVLHRSMSDLDAHTVRQCNLDLSGIDKELVEKYKTMRLESQYGSVQSHATGASKFSQISEDSSRQCSVTRGFSSSVPTHISSSRVGVRVCLRDSPWTCDNNSGPIPSRHESPVVPWVGAAGTSNCHGNRWRSCIFNDVDTEYAVISDDEESEDKWSDVIHPHPTRSLLTEQIAQIRSEPKHSMSPNGDSKVSDESKKTARRARRLVARKITCRKSGGQWRRVYRKTLVRRARRWHHSKSIEKADEKPLFDHGPGPGVEESLSER